MSGTDARIAVEFPPCLVVAAGVLLYGDEELFGKAGQQVIQQFYERRIYPYLAVVAGGPYQVLLHHSFH